MRIATFNVCGWKSAVQKGLLKWFASSSIDILAVQELRSTKISKPLELFSYSCVFNPSKFQGTCVISRVKPLSKPKLSIGMERFDKEGRFIQLEYEEFTFINVYMPHGRRDKKDLPYKLEAYDRLVSYLSSLIERREKPIILVGDFNVAFTKDDLAFAEENENNVMFTPEERKQIGRIISLGFVDAYRKVHRGKGGYTWWPRAKGFKERDLGWRIDYVFLTPELEDSIAGISVDKSVEISDHCPLVVELSLR